MNTLKGSLLLLIASVIWGTAFVAQAVGMEFIGPITFTFARFFLGAITILPLLIILERKNYIRTISKPNTFLLIFLTSLALGFGATIQQIALLNSDVFFLSFIKSGLITSTIFLYAVPGIE